MAFPAADEDTAAQSVQAMVQGHTALRGVVVRSQAYRALKSLAALPLRGEAVCSHGRLVRAKVES